MSKDRAKISLGYGVMCRSLGLSSGKTPSPKTNPHFEEVVARARINMECVIRILCWNFTNGIRYFRMSDHMIPQLYRSDAAQLCSRLAPDLHELRRIIDEWGIRVTFHHTGFALSADPRKWENYAARIIRYATILEELGPNAWMECHLGTRNLKVNWLDQMVHNIQSLPYWVQAKMTLENDAAWCPWDTLAVCQKTGLPFTYDIEHHRLFARTRVSEPPTVFTSESVATFVHHAKQTWDAREAATTVHVSSPVDPTAHEDTHADYVTFEDYARLRRALSEVGGQYYIVVEAKGMDEAVLQLQRLVNGRRPPWAIQDSGGSWV